MTIELRKSYGRKSGLVEKYCASQPEAALSAADGSRIAKAVAALAAEQREKPDKRNAIGDHSPFSEKWTVVYVRRNTWQWERPAPRTRTLFSLIAQLHRSVETVIYRSDAYAAAFWRHILRDFVWTYPASFVVGLPDADEFVALVRNERRRQWLTIPSQTPARYLSVRQRHQSGSAPLLFEAREYRAPVNWREILSLLLPPQLRDFIDERYVKRFASIVEAGRRGRTQPLPSWLDEPTPVIPGRRHWGARCGETIRGSSSFGRRAEARMTRFQ